MSELEKASAANSTSTSKSVIQRWGVKIGIILLASVWLTIIAASWARAAAADDDAGEDEYNFNWLDPDKKIYVLQNRKFTKAHRLVLSGMGNVGLSGTYRSTYGYDARAAFYFSEALGVEGFYSGFLNVENSIYEALKQSTQSANVLPVIRENRSQYGLLLHYVPWYAKINFFNQIIYFDWYLAGGGGMVNTALDLRTNALSIKQYEYEHLSALFLGTGHQYHINQLVTVRLDFTGAFYRAPIFGTQGENTWFSNYTFAAGVGLRL